MAYAPIRINKKPQENQREKVKAGRKEREGREESETVRSDRNNSDGRQQKDFGREEGVEVKKGREVAEVKLHEAPSISALDSSTDSTRPV